MNKEWTCYHIIPEQMFAAISTIDTEMWKKLKLVELVESYFEELYFLFLQPAQDKKTRCAEIARMTVVFYEKKNSHWHTELHPKACITEHHFDHELITL